MRTIISCTITSEMPYPKSCRIYVDSLKFHPQVAWPGSYCLHWWLLVHLGLCRSDRNLNGCPWLGLSYCRARCISAGHSRLPAAVSSDIPMVSGIQVNQGTVTVVSLHPGFVSSCASLRTGDLVEPGLLNCLRVLLESSRHYKYIHTIVL